MSTNDILVRRAAEAAELEELRRLEAEQAERERLRLGLAHQAVSELDQRFRELVGQRDRAARRLPDFDLQEPAWPSLSAADSQTSDGVERYAATIQALVYAFEQQLQKAIRQAEFILADRLARAECWREAAALEQALRGCHQNLFAVCRDLQERMPDLQMLDRPDNDASLSSLQRYIASLQAQVTGLYCQIASARQRWETRCVGDRLAGSRVEVASSARLALDEHHRQCLLKARQALQATLLEALRQARLEVTELPFGTQRLLDVAAQASEAPPQQHEYIRRLVARERVLQDQVSQALRLMQAPPDLVHAHPERALRWQALVKELQNVAAGLIPLSPHHGLEYEQIKADAQRDLDRRYVHTDFVRALREQDFHALSDEEGRLVIEDLRHLGVWLEETEALGFDRDSVRGGMATMLELKTDAPLDQSARDAQVIASVCERLQAASHSSGKVKGEHEVLDRKQRISRGRRPARLKSFSAQP